MTELAQNLIDGLGRGSIYALLALGVAVVFGVMHLLNFAHGELITVGGYIALWTLGRDGSWYVVAPLIVVGAVLTSLVIERVAFSRVRGSSDFTLLLTSFGVHFVISAIFLLYVSASVKPFRRPSWVTNTYSVGPLRIEVYDTVVIVVTVLTLIGTTLLLQRTMFGLSLRAAAADFDTARLMGVRSDTVIRGAFALSGLLAGIAGVFWLMRAGSINPSAGITPMLKGVLAALIGGLGSLRGAVIGGLVLGLAEVILRSRLPDSIASLTEGVVFLLIALLFIFRPQGLVRVAHAVRV
ncbi:branched-chain amino acid ABC transporter permease [Candidatus Poriferisodalis sp.]|uniref:branched-chain amino acid ABC transporter permease n=1 Tax=Candidatus Poriferisodalis sp. TaxID=3101277 RepID=UPI003B5BC8F9